MISLKMCVVHSPWWLKIQKDDIHESKKRKIKDCDSSHFKKCRKLYCIHLKPRFYVYFECRHVVLSRGIKIMKMEVLKCLNSSSKSHTGVCMCCLSLKFWPIWSAVPTGYNPELFRIKSLYPVSVRGSNLRPPRSKILLSQPTSFQSDVLTLC
jgi:hypothetical protein